MTPHLPPRRGTRARFEAIKRRAFDTRLGRVGLTGGAGLLARGVALLPLLVSIPLATRTLSPQAFGAWMLVGSLALAFGFLDLGIGNSVMNEVAAADGRGDIRAMRRAIANGLILSVGIMVIVLAGGGATIALVDWAAMFDITDPVVAAQIAPSLFVFLFALAFGLPLAVPMRAQAGLQYGVVQNLTTVVASLVAFALTVVGLALHWPLVALTAALFLPNLVVQCVIVALFLGRFRPDLRPGRVDVVPEMMHTLIGSSILFFLMQLFALLAIRFDAFLIASKVSIVEAGGYATLDRIFAAAAVFSIAFLGPLWPAYREALYNRDGDWITRRFRHSLIVASLVTGGVGMGIVIGWPIIAGYMGSVAGVGIPLVAAMALSRLGETSYTAITTLLNALGQLRASLLLSAGIVLIGIPAKLLLLHRFGILGVPAVNAVAYLLIGTLPGVVLFPRLLARAIAVAAATGRGT